MKEDKYLTVYLIIHHETIGTYPIEIEYFANQSNNLIK